MWLNKSTNVWFRGSKYGENVGAGKALKPEQNLLECEDAQRSIRLVACIVSHPFAPEVVAENIPEAGAWSDVRVVDDGPHIIVD